MSVNFNSNPVMPSAHVSKAPTKLPPLNMTLLREEHKEAPLTPNRASPRQFLQVPAAPSQVHHGQTTPRTGLAQALVQRSDTAFTNYANQLQRVEQNPNTQCCGKVNARTGRCLVGVCKPYMKNRVVPTNPCQEEASGCCCKVEEETNFQRIKDKISEIMTIAKCCVFIPGVACCALASISRNQNNQVAPAPVAPPAIASPRTPRLGLGNIGGTQPNQAMLPPLSPPPRQEMEG